MLTRTRLKTSQGHDEAKAKAKAKAKVKASAKPALRYRLVKAHRRARKQREESPEWEEVVHKRIMFQPQQGALSPFLGFSPYLGSLLVRIGSAYVCVFYLSQAKIAAPSRAMKRRGKQSKAKLRCRQAVGAVSCQNLTSQTNVSLRNVSSNQTEPVREAPGRDGNQNSNEWFPFGHLISLSSSFSFSSGSGLPRKPSADPAPDSALQERGLKIKGWLLVIGNMRMGIGKLV